MPKRKNYLISKRSATLAEALRTFDLKILKNWLKDYDKPLYKQFLKNSEEIQMATMCRMICTRTDLLSHECHKKALQWLKDHHNMNGRLF